MPDITSQEYATATDGPLCSGDFIIAGSGTESGVVVTTVILRTDTGLVSYRRAETDGGVSFEAERPPDGMSVDEAEEAAVRNARELADLADFMGIVGNDMEFSYRIGNHASTQYQETK